MPTEITNQDDNIKCPQCGCTHKGEFDLCDQCIFEEEDRMHDDWNGSYGDDI